MNRVRQNPVHHFANRTLLIRLHFSALLFIVFAASMALLPASIVWGTVFYDPRGLQVSTILLPVAFLSGLMFMLVSSEVRCPLCRGQVLRRPSGGGIARGVGTCCGSYRLKVILSMVFRGHFRCIHCGEHCDTTRPRH